MNHLNRMLKFFSFFILISIVVSCSSTDTKKSEEESSEEKFPKVDLKKYSLRTFENEFEFLIPKELTESGIESDNSILGFSHLSKEKHVFVERELISTYKKSLKARDINEKNVLLSFAKERLPKFKGVLKTSTTSKLIESEINKLACLRTEFEGTSYGFPKTKYFSIRYFQGKKYLYSVVCWTVDKSRKEFKNEALVVGLSFKETK